MRVVTLVAAGVWLAAASPAFADHPRLDEARERFRAADLPGAIQALDAAEEASDLSRADLLAVLELRTLIQLALGHSEQAERTLRQIATIEPEHRFGPEAPPDVMERFTAIVRSQQGPVTVEVDRRTTADGVTLSPQARGDREDMVRGAEVHARVDGGPWQRARNEPLRLSAVPGARVEWYAVAVGPGGAPLATRGSADSPLRFAVAADPLSPSDDGDGGGAWVWIGVGAGVVAVAAVVTIIAISAGGEASTTVDGPNGFPP